jgi:hypothetical protein
MIVNFYIIKNRISKTFRHPPQIGSQLTSLGNTVLSSQAPTMCLKLCHLKDEDVT